MDIEIQQRIVRLTEVQNLTGLSRSAIYAQIAIDNFPTPIVIGKRSVGWLQTEISAWIADRIDQSRKSSSTELNS